MMASSDDRTTSYDVDAADDTARVATPGVDTSSPGAHLAGASKRSVLTLGVDLDGVCADHEEAFRRAYSSISGVPVEQLPPQSTFDAFSEWGLDRRTFEAAHRQAVLQHRIFATMPTIPGAAEALWQLSDMGVWIRIITHRLVFPGTHDVVGMDTMSWLNGQHLPRPLVIDGVERPHLIPYQDICYIGDKPDVGADLYVDDAPHNIVRLREAGREAIVFDHPYNRGLEGPRATNWSQVVAHVQSELTRRDAQQQLPFDP